jgi:hypothetical protein
MGTALAHAASLTIALDQPTEPASAGQTLNFFGTIANNTNATIYLNSDDLDFSSAGFSVIDQFFNTVPISLAPSGQPGSSSGDIELFDVGVNNPFGGSPAVYSGTYTLFGGADGGADTAQDNLGSATFAVAVTPEPSTIYLLAAGLGAVSMAARARARAAQAS